MVRFERLFYAALISLQVKIFLRAFLRHMLAARAQLFLDILTLVTFGWDYATYHNLWALLEMVLLNVLKNLSYGEILLYLHGL